MNTTIPQIFVKAGRYGRSFFISLFTEKVNPKKFRDIYAQTLVAYLREKDSYDYKDYVMPEWQENTDAIEGYFTRGFDMSFLRNSTIKKTMFMYTLPFWKNVQKKLIAEEADPKLASLILRESNVGNPLLNDWQHASSGNNIHHYYHLLKFFKETKSSAKDISTVVEVGGGYGNMAKIFKKLRSDSTYVIFDIPIFSYIQALYLRTMLGTDEVVLLSKKSDRIKKGKVNIVPLNDRAVRQVAIELHDTDLFLSTWALSESNQKMQELVKGLRYFDAKQLLIAYQKSNDSFGFAENVTDIKPEYAVTFNAETDYLRDNYYLFARRSN